ncbi:MAG: hypothetical protein ACX98W_15605 [bacterium]
MNKHDACMDRIFEGAALLAKAFVSVLGTILLGASVLVGLGLPSGARAEEPRSPGADRWIPSVAFDSGLTVQDWKGSVSSQICRGCSIPDPMMREEALQPPAAGDDRDQTPFVSLQVEILSPELPLPGTPRFFFGGEIAPTFGSDRKVAIVGEVGPIGTRSPNPETQSFSAESAAGQGSEVVLERERLTFGAHAGLAFPFEIYGRPVQIKPSIGWTRFSIDFQGQVADADCLPVIRSGAMTTECNPNDLGVGQAGDQFGLGFLRETRLTDKDSRSFDGIGPGLHIEMDAGPAGPFRTSVFAGFRIYRILGNRDFDTRVGPRQIFDEINVDQGRPADEVSARFAFDVDEWLYRAGVGVRIQWLGWDD